MPDRLALLRAIEAAAPDAIPPLFAGADEDERRPHAKEVLAITRRLNRFHALRLEGERLAWQEDSWDFSQVRAADIACLAVCSFSELQKLGRRAPAWLEAEPAFRVLAERNPPWLSDWATWAIDAVEEPSSAWALIRRLVREGLAGAPDNDAYIEGMIIAPAWGGPDTRRAAGLLRDDPALLEREVWRLFEVEGEVNSLSAADSNGGAGWQDALLECIADGRLDRGRVLDATFDALSRDFSQYKAGWFVRFLTALEPSEDELRARLDAVLQLLHAAAPTVVGLGVDLLTRLIRAEGDLDALLVLDHLPAALASDRKGTANKALALLERLVARDPARAGDAATAAAIALAHPAAEVQARALKVIAAWAPEPGPDLRAAVERAADVVAAVNRAALAALLGDAPSTPAAVGPAEVPPADRTRGSVLLDELRIEPVADLDELLDLWLRLLEGQVGSDDRERALDAVSRFCHDRAAFRGPLAPLAARLADFLDEQGRPFGDDWQGLSDVDVALAWFTGKIGKARHDGPMHVRRHELARRAADGMAGPLLALPTHQGGWIDPVVFVERARTWGKGLSTDSTELAQALLRLAPERTDEALRAAENLPGRAGTVIRIALGSGEKLRLGGGVALTAARARHAEPHRIEVRLEHVKQQRISWAHGGTPEELDATYPVADVRFDPPVGKRESQDPAQWLPATVLFDDTMRMWDPSGGVDLLHTWPVRRDYAFAWALRFAVANSGAYASPAAALEHLLETMLHPAEPVSPLAARVLVFCFAGGVEAEHRMAFDVLAELADRGRVDVGMLVEAVREPLHGGFLMHNRLGARLRALGEVSPLHAELARSTLEGVLDLAPGHKPQGLHATLDALAELRVATGRPVTSAPTRAYLESITGSSKAAKAAKVALT